MKPRVFILSPASCGGRRAQILLNEKARFEMATRVRSPLGAPLGEVFSFLSGLYFRGKLAYAKAFARPAGRTHGAMIITPNRGLLPADELVDTAVLRQFGEVPIDESDARYREPLARDMEALVARLSPRTEVVLLGSIATGKYCNVLMEFLGRRLLFPSDFVGRGDMSRGGLLLRCVDEARELAYVPVEGAIRHGVRPAKLPRRP